MRLVLIGASGHGKVCTEIAELMISNGSRDFGEIIFLDDNRDLVECCGHPVVGIESDFDKYINDNTEFFVSVGNAETRKRIQERIEMVHGSISILIHPDAVIGCDVNIGIGSVIIAGTVINSGCKIGKGVIINTSSSVDHDCIIEDFVHVSVGAHICGAVRVGDNTWIGAGATVINNVNICSNATIGAGAVVTKDIDEAGIYVGVPARRIS